MKSPAKALKNAYEATLQALSVGGRQTHFYKTLPESKGNRFMYISNYVENQRSTKDSFGTEAVMEITCVAPDRGGMGDKDESDDIADEVIQAVVVQPGSFMSVTGFYIITLTLDDSTSDIRKVNGEVASIRILRFRHVLGES